MLLLVPASIKDKQVNKYQLLKKIKTISQIFNFIYLFLFA